jgi:FAD/FMN-containing dehydrogenase
MGGVYSAEHGTGKRKRTDFIECFGNDGVEQVRISKAALDPDFLLNRGNVIAS